LIEKAIKGGPLFSEMWK